MALLGALGVLFLVSFAFNVVTRIADDFVGGFNYWELVQTAVTYPLGTLLLGVLLRKFPAVQLRWHHVWRGAALTMALLMASKYLLALYVSRASIASTYGTAGTLIAYLIWVYVSAQIVLIGAEFIQVDCRIRGIDVPLAKGATRREI